MNSLNDVIQTLLPDARHLAEGILAASRENFERDGQVWPVAFAVQEKPGKPEIKIIGIEKLNDQTKPAVWAMMAQLREAHPVVCFVSEVWMVKGDKDHPADLSVMTRNNPQRQEAVQLALWQGSRTVLFAAFIHRHPTKLEDWQVMFDSAFPTEKGGEKIAGRMMDGKPYPLDQS